MTQITISNNQQNPVLPWALRAMDNRQVDLADKFRNELGIFYSRQEGAFENLTDDEKEELGIEDSKDIRIRPLAQTFLAVQGDVYNMAHLPDVFESQKLYQDTFKSAYINSNARSIVLAYKVGLMMSGVTVRLRESLAQKYQAAVPKARNLTWALLIQALLNDKKFSVYVEDYGSETSERGCPPGHSEATYGKPRCATHKRIVRQSGLQRQSCAGEVRFLAGNGGVQES